MEFTEYSTFYVGQLSQGLEDEEKLSLMLTTDRYVSLHSHIRKLTSRTQTPYELYLGSSLSVLLPPLFLYSCMSTGINAGHIHRYGRHAVSHTFSLPLIRQAATHQYADGGPV